MFCRPYCSHSAGHLLFSLFNLVQTEEVYNLQQPLLNPVLRQVDDSSLESVTVSRCFQSTCFVCSSSLTFYTFSCASSLPVSFQNDICFSVDNEKKSAENIE